MNNVFTIDARGGWTTLDIMRSTIGTKSCPIVDQYENYLQKCSTAHLRVVFHPDYYVHKNPSESYKLFGVFWILLGVAIKYASNSSCTLLGVP